MIITAWQGRIASVATTARLECQAALTIEDIRVLKSRRLSRGPRISTRNGGFSFTANGVYFHGTLSKSSAMGGATMTRAGYQSGDFCRASGRFNLRRKPGL